MALKQTLGFVVFVFLALLTFRVSAEDPTDEVAPDQAITPVEAATPVEPPVPAVPAAGEGQDFASDARLILRVVACAGDEPLPPNIDPNVVERHCKEFLPKLESYRKKYVGKAMAFLGKLRPPNLPATVVYPFGGGDLLSALTTYPDATRFITISLEHAGDPRRLREMSSAKLEKVLAPMRRGAWGLLMADNSTSDSLIKLESGDIPGQLAFFIIAMAIHGFEPVSLRYFQIRPDGSLHYLSKEDIAAVEDQKAQKLHWKWKPPDLSVAFSNLELIFKPMGSGPDAPVKMHRHIAANLRDDYLDKDPSLLRYLEKEGRVSAMTKAASYCLWDGRFSKIRQYLLDNMEFMISDSTGIPPRLSKAAGFTMETFGAFEKALVSMRVRESVSAELRNFWKSQPHRALGFRYGYVDGHGSNHLLVTRRAPKAGTPGNAAPPDAVETPAAPVKNDSNGKTP